MDWTSTQLCSDLVYGLVYPQIFDSHKRRSDEAQAATLERAKERAQTWLTVLNDQSSAGQQLPVRRRADDRRYHAVSYVALAEVIGSDLAAYPNVKRLARPDEGAEELAAGVRGDRRLRRDAEGQADGRRLSASGSTP